MAPAETSGTNAEPDPKTKLDEAKQAVKDKQDLIKETEKEVEVGEKKVKEEEKALERIQKSINYFSEGKCQGCHIRWYRYI